MARVYDSHDAKARFGEIIRSVMAGQRVTIRYRGVAVAEIRPLEPAAQTLEQRLDELRAEGQLTAPDGPPTALGPLAQVPRGLARFLEERD